MSLKKTLISWLAALALGLPVFTSGAIAHDPHKITVLAGFPGWDHLMPFLALTRNLGFYERYGLDVDFKGGNYLRAWQTAQSGRWDAGYLSFGDTFILNDRGVKTKVVASTLYGAAVVSTHNSIKGPQDLKGKTAGIIHPRHWMYYIFKYQILPAHGLKPDDMKYRKVSVNEGGLVLSRNEIQAYYMFEPQGTNYANNPNVKILWEWREVCCKGEIYRNALAMNAKFIQEHPDLAKKVVWAHLDAMNFIEKSPEAAASIMQRESRIPLRAVVLARDKSGRDKRKIPMDYVQSALDGYKKIGWIKKALKASEVVDYSMHKGYTYKP
ncbi:MAG: ABC transporter substrate-binding protein [Nitrospinota bacterium]